MALPLLETVIGTLYPEIAGIIRQLSPFSSITGWDALLNGQLIAGGFRIIVALPIAYAIIALIGILILLRAGGQARLLSQLIALGGLLVIGIMVFNIPNLSRLGYGDNWLVAAGVSLLGYTPDLGFWMSILGTVAIAGGMTLCYFAEQPERQAEFSSPFS